MQPSERVIADGSGERLGTIDTLSQPLDGSQPQVLVRLDNGQPVWVPYDLLEPQTDGSYRLRLSRRQLEFQDTAEQSGNIPAVMVIPVIEEELKVAKRQVTSGVRVTKRVHQREEVVDEPGFVEDVQVERVARNQVVEKPVAAHYEGDTLVIPLLEEVLVVEKRLILREEIRITKQRREIRQPQRVSLRSEEAIIEPISETQNRTDT